MYLVFEDGITIMNRYSKANSPYMGNIRGKTLKDIMVELGKRTNTEQQFSIKAVCEYFPDFSEKEIKALRKKMENREIFNPQEKATYIQYLDANNLYGWAISQPLPTRNFKWLTEDEINSKLENYEEIKGCKLEVDLEYPKELHDYHYDYPLAPESIEFNKVKKLIPNSNDKENYLFTMQRYKYYLQHKRPCSISIYKLEPKARVVYLIQHGREFCT